MADRPAGGVGPHLFGKLRLSQTGTRLELDAKSERRK